MSATTIPGQVWLVKSERDWRDKHAKHEGGQWYCKKANKPIEMLQVSHSVQAAPGIDSGETRIVLHMHCSACQDKRRFENGSPIQESELVRA